MGLILAVSLRDPLRDTLEFSKFAWGVALGCLVLLLPSLRVFNYQRFATWCYTPLFGALALFVLLMRFGSGPGGQRREGESGAVPAGGSDQDPAGVFPGRIFRAQLGAAARSAREAAAAAVLRWIGLPRLSHVLPVMFAVALALGFFFLLKDLGPALVTGFLFLAMFWVARGRAGLAVLGIVLAGGRRGGRISLGQADDGGGSHQHVAVALGQRRARRQSTGAFAVGVFDRAARWDRGRDGAIRR